MGSALTTIGLPVALGIIMFGLGLSLTLGDFARVAKQPKAVIIALLCQLIVLPAICFGLVLAFQLPPVLAVGMMMLAASPCVAAGRSPAASDSSPRWTSRAGWMTIPSTRRSRPTRAIPGAGDPASCPTTAASSGTAPPSWWCRSRARQRSAYSECIPRISGCCTIPPTNTRRRSRLPSGWEATW